MKSWSKWNQVKLELVQTLPKIIHLASRKSHMVIICPNSQSWPKSKLGWIWFEHCSESLIWPLGSHACSLIVPFHMKSWTKLKLGKVIMFSRRGLESVNKNLIINIQSRARPSFLTLRDVYCVISYMYTL